jgi:amino acid adenylation domain-containing protein
VSGEKDSSPGDTRRVRHLTKAERHKILAEWNNTKADYPRDKCIHELFEEQAQKSPDAVAAVCGKRQWTYGELNRRANQVANHLRALGVGPEAMVGICLGPSLEMVAGLLGILKAGGAYVPIDPGYPRERVRFILEDSSCGVLLADKKCGALLRDVSDGAKVCDIADIPSSFGEIPARACKAHNLAYVIYTSGSTGRPKGCLITHRNVVRLMKNDRPAFNFTSSDVWIMAHSFSFDFSVWEMYGALLNGGRLVIPSREDVRDTWVFLRLIKQHRVTVLNQTPSAFYQLMTEEEKEPPELDSHLRYIIFGGEKLDPSLLTPWVRRYSPEKVQLINMYGITETTVHVTLCNLSLAAIIGSSGGSPIGRPLPETTVYIVDDNMNLLPPGETGELCVGGAGVCRGYLNRPDLTEEKFIHDAFSSRPGAKLYRSGDLGRWLSDGSIEYGGRKDEQVKIRGYRIECGEIEYRLRQHHDVAAVVVEAKELRAGDKELVAYIAGSSRVNARGLRKYLGEFLPDYMIPSAFVFLDALPLTSHGKIDRKALPVPVRSRGVSGYAYSPPRTPDEETLAGVWAEVLGLRRVGINDGFFELGGHSLLAAQIISRMREAFKVELPLGAIFENPTVAGISGVMHDYAAERRNNYLPPVIRASRDSDLPLSFSQERIWFISELYPDNLAYNFEAALWFKGTLNVEALQRSLNEILRRHEIYRTTFSSRDDRPVQVIHEHRPLKLHVADISGIEEGKRRDAAWDMIRREFLHKFDLSRLPLVRWTLVRLRPEEYVFIHTEHHLVHDGWSFNVFLGELTELYNAFSQGKPSPLTEPLIQFADFAHWQRQWMEGEVAEKQLAYWKKRLRGYSGRVDLPMDRPRPAVQTFHGSTLSLELPYDLCEALRSFSRGKGVSLYITMLAAFFILVHRYTGQTDICIGAGIANRRLREVEGILGMVINTVVLRADLSVGPSFHEFLQHVRDVCLGAYANQDVPFDKVVEAVQPPRSLSYSPLFQIMFSFHDSPLGELDFAGLETSLIEGLSQAAKFDLNIIVIPRSEQSVGRRGKDRNRGITVLWEYNTDLFDSSTIENMARHYEKILRGVGADKLSLTTHGGRDGKALPAPAPFRGVSRDAYSPPRTPEEAALAGIWEEVLGIERVGVNDNFFELGGHSLLATRIIARMGRVFETALPLSSIFERPTVAGLVGLLEWARLSSVGDETSDREGGKGSEKGKL